MSLKNKIHNYLPELSDVEIIDAHREVMESINKLKELIPKEYADYNLTNIIMPKSYGYHTILDTSFYQYNRIKESINKLSHNEYISGLIAYKLLQKKKSSINTAVKDNKDEIPIKFSDKKHLFVPNADGRSYNIFSANTQTYLRVMVLYMNRSRFDNHLLVVPKCLENVEILKKANKTQLLFFEDYITEEIILKYQNAKKVFSTIFNTNKNKLREIFFFDSRDFLQIVDIGLENVFRYLLPQAFLFCLTYEEIFSRIKVKNVIGARVRKIYDRGLYESASKHNINRYVLLHSNIGTDIKFIHSMGHFTDLTGVFTWGNLQKELIENDSFSNVKKIYVTGSPLFEKSNKNINNNSKYDKCIFYAATHNDLQEVKELVKITNSLPRTTSLIIKVHPDKDHKPYEKYIQSEHVKLVPGESSLEDLLPQVDLLVTTISESALQAMIRNVPTLFLLINQGWKQLLFSLYGFNQKEKELLVVDKKELLVNKIHKILYSEEYRLEFLKDQDEFLNKRIRMHSDTDGAATEIDKILN